jgi:hypothetical protein
LQQEISATHHQRDFLNIPPSSFLSGPLLDLPPELNDQSLNLNGLTYELFQ